MENNWSKALKDSISEVFSTMFFMVPEWEPVVEPELAASEAQGWLEGSLEVTRQKIQIGLWVWCPRSLAAELAANILAVDPPDLDETMILDAYREMINMVAGGLLTTVDPQGQWRMGLPQSRVCGPGPLGTLLAPTKTAVSCYVDEQPVLAGLSLRAC